MSEEVKDDTYRTQKILFYCEAIVEFLKNKSYEEFRKNHQLNFAISFALSQIGEEAVRLTEEFRTKYQHILWRNMIGVRHRIVHDDLGANMMVLWEVAQESIPALLEAINQILKAAD